MQIKPSLNCTVLIVVITPTQNTRVRLLCLQCDRHHKWGMINHSRTPHVLGIIWYLKECTLSCPTFCAAANRLCITVPTGPLADPRTLTSDCSRRLAIKSWRSWLMAAGWSLSRLNLVRRDWARVINTSAKLTWRTKSWKTMYYLTKS